jgi:hypothetical protein
MEHATAEKCVAWSQQYADKHFPGLKLRYRLIENDGSCTIAYDRPTSHGLKTAEYSIDPPVTRELAEHAVEMQVKEVITRRKK